MPHRNDQTPLTPLVVPVNTMVTWAIQIFAHHTSGVMILIIPTMEQPYFSWLKFALSNWIHSLRKSWLPSLFIITNSSKWFPWYNPTIWWNSTRTYSTRCNVRKGHYKSLHEMQIPKNAQKQTKCSRNRSERRNEYMNSQRYCRYIAF